MERGDCFLNIHVGGGSEGMLAPQVRRLGGHFGYTNTMADDND